MSLALTLQVVRRELRNKRSYLIATPSGNYTQGGDTVNLNNITLAIGQSTADAVGYPGVLENYEVVSAPPGFSAQLNKGSLLTNWGLQVFQNATEAPIGTPITLGPLSAAGTQSVYTTNGVLTVSTTTPPPLGSFVLLTNGATNFGIFLNGVIGYVASVVAGTSFTVNYGSAKALHYAVGTDTIKWQQLFAGNTLNPIALGTASGQSIAVSAVAVASNVLTVTCTNTGTSVGVGNFFILQGLAAGEVPQGVVCQVLTASTTSITANIICPNLSATSGETATLTVLVTNGNAPIQASQDSFGINGSTVAATARSATAAGAITVLPCLQTLPPGSISVIQGLTHGSALNGFLSAVLTTGLTSTNLEFSGYIETAVTTGTADLGAVGLLATGMPVDTITGELPTGPYPAGALAGTFVLMIEGPKLRC